MVLQSDVVMPEHLTPAAVDVFDSVLDSPDCALCGLLDDQVDGCVENSLGGLIEQGNGFHVLAHATTHLRSLRDLTGAGCGLARSWAAARSTS